MPARLVINEYELRGRTFELWSDGGRRFLSAGGFEVDTDKAFDPPLTNEELCAIDDTARGQ